MKLFSEMLKHPTNMTDEELENVVTMLRQLRATSLTQATKSIKTRTKKEGGAKKRLPKTVDIAKLTELLTPEQREKFIAQMTGTI